MFVSGLHLVQQFRLCLGQQLSEFNYYSLNKECMLLRIMYPEKHDLSNIWPFCPFGIDMNSKQPE